mgnify:FL=1
MSGRRQHPGLNHRQSPGHWAPLQRNFRTVASVALLLALGGCSLLPPPRAREVFIRQEFEEALALRPVVIESVAVEAGVATPRVQENVLYIYELLLGRINAERPPEGPDAALSSKGLRLVVSVHETAFVSGFETKNAVSVETRIYTALADRVPQPIVVALYSEETESTIAPYRYLYEIIEKSISEVFR